MLTQKLTSEQKVEFQIDPTTESGKPATVDGTPVWTVVDGKSTLEVAADGLSATVISEDSAGETNILVEADADRGAGIVTISDTIRIIVESPNAASLGLTAGTPEDK